MSKKSDNACKGVARAPHRSLYYASGYTDEEQDLLKLKELRLQNLKV